jgi:uncharacterized membrane protein YidH (DUF202 family)
MSEEPRIYDPAAQLERTALAWSRASVAILANGALLVRAGLVYNRSILTAAGLLAAVVGILLWLLAAAYYSRSAGRRVGHLLARRPRAAAALATFVTLLSITALLATMIR